MSDLQQARIEAAAEYLYDWQTGSVGYFHTSNHKELWIHGARQTLAAADSVATVPPLHPDEREPIANNPLLRGIDLALDRLIRRDCFTERTLRLIDELREEVLP